MANRQKKKPKNIKKTKPPKNDKKNIVEIAPPPIPYSQDIPVHNILGYYDINTDYGLSECLEDIIHCMKDGYYLRWEAVVRHEQGLPLSKLQEEALDELISFKDEDDDETILYIDEIPRPNEPWYETLRKVVPKLILDPFETYRNYLETYHEGWSELVECLDNYLKYLPLPEGVETPVDVIPENIRHRLWLQNSFNMLSGIGQEEELTLENEDQKPWRIEGFIDDLKKYKDSVQYFDLTIETLLQMVILPLKDEKIFVESLLKELKMKSVSEAIYDHL
jgi:hypothetical protein